MHSIRILFPFLIILLTLNQRGSSQKVPKIAFILATEKEERYQKDKKFFADEIRKLGAELFYAHAEGNQEKQVEIVKTVVGKGVDVIVIQPVNSFQAKLAVEIAKSKGVKVVAYDRIIYDADIDYYVSHNSVMVGIIQASEAVKYLNGKGNVVILAGGKDHSVAKQISAGNLMILDRYPNIKVMGIFYHENWDEKESYVTMKNILKQSRDVNAVLANNSSLIRGAIKALKEEGIANVFTAGADADLENCRLIVKGEQNIDILKDVESLSRTAAKVAVDIAKGKSPEFSEKLNNGKVDVKVVFVPVEVVNKENIERVIIQRGFHKKEDIFR